MTMTTVNGQRNPTRSFGSLNSCGFVLCSSMRGCETRGQITLASLRGAAYLAHGIIFLYSTISRIPLRAFSFLHVRNGHHVPRCLWRNKKIKKETHIHGNSRYARFAREVSIAAREQFTIFYLSGKMRERKARCKNFQVYSTMCTKKSRNIQKRMLVLVTFSSIFIGYKQI